MSAPAEIAPELAEMSASMLVPPSVLLQPTDDRAAWVEFLRRLGVLDRLPVRQTRDTRSLYGRQLGRAGISAISGIPVDIVADWAPHVLVDCGAQYPETPYRSRDTVTWIPGQGAFDRLPGPVKAAYSRLVLAGLASWPEDHFGCSCSAGAGVICGSGVTLLGVSA